MTREIKKDVAKGLVNDEAILDNQEAIKNDTTEILQEISRLRAQLPDDGATLIPSKKDSDSTLAHYLDDLTSYAETVCWSGEDSDTDDEKEAVETVSKPLPAQSKRFVPSLPQISANTEDRSKPNIDHAAHVSQADINVTHRHRSDMITDRVLRQDRLAEMADFERDAERYLITAGRQVVNESFTAQRPVLSSTYSAPLDHDRSIPKADEGAKNSTRTPLRPSTAPPVPDPRRDSRRRRHIPDPPLESKHTIDETSFCRERARALAETVAAQESADEGVGRAQPVLGSKEPSDDSFLDDIPRRIPKDSSHIPVVMPNSGMRPTIDARSKRLNPPPARERSVEQMNAQPAIAAPPTLRCMLDSTVRTMEYLANQRASEHDTAGHPYLAPRLTKISRLLPSFPKFPP
jgi:hypothetical protein